MSMLRRVADQVFATLQAQTWVSSVFGVVDCDDLIHSIELAASLVENHGFDHARMLKRFRTPPSYRLFGQDVGFQGVMPSYKGQWNKMRRNSDPHYLASDGVTTGAAMRTMLVGAYMAYDRVTLIEVADRAARLTHGTNDAALSAVLVALRYRQLILGDDDPAGLLLDLEEACAAVAGRDGDFFRDRVHAGAEALAGDSDPLAVADRLSRAVGLMSLCYCVPIFSVFWSYVAPADYESWVHREGYKAHVRFGGAILRGDSLDCRVAERIERRLTHLRALTGFLARHGSRSFEDELTHHVDEDTTFHLVCGFAAAKHGVSTQVAATAEAAFAGTFDLRQFAADVAAGPLGVNP